MKSNYKIISAAVLILILFVMTKSSKLKIDIQGKHTWRQSVTALNIKNFTRYDFNIFNPRVAHYNINNCNIQRREFPLLQWIIAVVQKCTLEHIFIVRICILFISLISLVGIFKIGTLFWGKMYGILGLYVFSFFPVFYYHSINPIPDILALCFGIYFLFYYFKYIQTNKIHLFYISTVFLGLSSLCKLPFIIYAALPVFYFFLHFKKIDLRVNYIIAFMISLLPVILWYGSILHSWTDNRIQLGVFDQSVSMQMMCKFFMIQFYDTFPRSIFNYASSFLLVWSLYILQRKNVKSIFLLYIKLGTIITFFYFLFVLKHIREGHDYYQFPFLPFVCLIILFGVQELVKNSLYKKLIIIVFIAMPIFCFIETKDNWNIELSSFNEDLFIHRKALRDIVSPNERVIMLNDHSSFIMPYQIDKEGFIFMNDDLPFPWILHMIEESQVTHCYSDSRGIDTAVEFKKYVDDTLLQAGSVKVFRLKTPEQL